MTWNMSLPDDSPTRILRRGTLSCPANGGNCDFTLTVPDDVRSVDYEATKEPTSASK